MAAPQRHPQLSNHGAALLDDDEVENRTGTLNTGDEAGDAIVERMRELGRQALGQWAEPRHAAVPPAGAPELRQVGKKTPLKNDPRRSRVERPNLAERNGDAAAILRRRRLPPRGCSRRLQGALIDFGADHGRAKAAAKIREHYGASVPGERARAVTRRHARVLAKPRFRGGGRGRCSTRGITRTCWRSRPCSRCVPCRPLVRSGLCDSGETNTAKNGRFGQGCARRGGRS